MPWKQGDGTPYSGFYNGNIAMMIANGTYADYRPRIVQRVENGFYGGKGPKVETVAKGQEKLAAWDKEWEAIPLEERMRRRAVVLENVTPKEITKMTIKGPLRVVVTEPSDNDNLDPKRGRAKGEKKFTRKLIPGSIATFSNPLVPTPA